MILKSLDIHQSTDTLSINGCNFVKWVHSQDPKAQSRMVSEMEKNCRVTANDLNSLERVNISAYHHLYAKHRESMVSMAGYHGGIPCCPNKACHLPWSLARL